MVLTILFTIKEGPENIFARTLGVLFNMSLYQSKLLGNWKGANVS